MESLTSVVPSLVMAALFVAVAVTAFKATDRAAAEDAAVDAAESREGTESRDSSMTERKDVRAEPGGTDDASRQ